MSFEEILQQHFGDVTTEVEFVKKTYHALRRFGFTEDNTIAAVCVCRDEIAQSMRSIIKHVWGEAFCLSGLGAMFFAGKTALRAAMHHSPKEGGRERYVYYALSHIAIDEEGRMGYCRRKGIPESMACGALCGFLGELREKKVEVSIDAGDIEQSHLKMRLLKEIPYGTVPDLLELTRTAQKVILEDIEKGIQSVVDTKKSDYALITGIQIHGPEYNYVEPGTCYAMVDELRYELTQHL